jgi:predicted RNA-binding Zn ribbon-like protein
MTAPPKTRLLQDGPAFKYLGGDISLDFVNTVDWAAQGLVNERLTSYERLTRWAERAGLLGSTHGERLRAAARKQPQPAQATLQRAKRLRVVLRQIYQSLAAGAGRGAEWENFNHELTRALRRLRIGSTLQQGSERHARWTWSVASGSLDSFLWPIVWSAAKLLTSEEAARIRTCGGTDCGWMYVDRSRNGLRRWCAMQTCGTVEKTRRRRERRRQNKVSVPTGSSGPRG